MRDFNTTVTLSKTFFLQIVKLSSVGAEPLKRAELVKFALRAQTFCPAVYIDVSLQLSSLIC